MKTINKFSCQNHLKKIKEGGNCFNDLSFSKFNAMLKFSTYLILREVSLIYLNSFLKKEPKAISPPPRIG